MMRSTFPTSEETIRRLRRQINREDDHGKLKDLVVRLTVALHEQHATRREPVHFPGKNEKNPFDAVLF
jgi:hypothetical protein